MNNEQKDYYTLFRVRKTQRVFEDAIDYIKEVLENDNRTERQKFDEITTIIAMAQEHVE